MEREVIYELENQLGEVRSTLTPMAYYEHDLRIARSHIFRAIDALKFLEEDSKDTTHFHNIALKQCELIQKYLDKYLAKEDAPYDSNYGKVEDMNQMVASAIEML